jgi:hypothetical protein
MLIVCLGDRSWRLAHPAATAVGYRRRRDVHTTLRSPD